MVRLTVCIALMVVAGTIFILWKMSVYPFTEVWFNYDGYAMHLVGGVGYTAFQVLITQLSVPHAPMNERFINVQAVAASHLLFGYEFMQLYDTTRKVQMGDVVLQTLGVLLCLWILFLTRKQTHER